MKLWSKSKHIQTVDEFDRNRKYGKGWREGGEGAVV